MTRTRPGPQGGDQRSGRIEAHVDFILTMLAKRDDLPLVELQGLLNERTIHRLWTAIGRIIDLCAPKNTRTTSPTAATMQTERKPLVL